MSNEDMSVGVDDRRLHTKMRAVDRVSYSRPMTVAVPNVVLELN